MLVFDGEVRVEKHATENLVYLTVISDTGEVAVALLDWDDADKLIDLLQETV